MSATRSSFVDVLAWALLVGNVLGIVIALLQLALVDAVTAEMLATPPLDALPAGSLDLLRGFAIFFLVFSAFMTYAAYALLRRREWARRVHVVMFALGIVWGVLWTGLVALGFDMAAIVPADVVADLPELDAAMRATRVVVLITTIALCVLLAWLIKRLRTPEVKSEFTARRTALSSLP